MQRTEEHSRPETEVANPSKLRILVLGSLGPNQDRILALSKHVSHLVFAYTEFHPNLLHLDPQLECVAAARRNLAPQIRSLIARHGINVVYSLLNAPDESTEATLELLDEGLEVPIVRHYKEHPCLPTLEERRVLLETAGQIYINNESFEYFRSAYQVRASSAHIMDADMISERYMSDDFALKEHTSDGKPHLLVAGGMSILNDRLDVRDLCFEMNRQEIHVHLYGYMAREHENRLIVGDPDTKRSYEELQERLPYVHWHQYISPRHFCEVWSRYDAGFMHPRVDRTDKAARFEELNLPQRYTAYLAAGLPLAVCREGQSAMKRFVEEKQIGFVYSDYEELGEILHDRSYILALNGQVRAKRKEFSFEASADHLARILECYARQCC